jgi:hypothetical protein
MTGTFISGTKDSVKVLTITNEERDCQLAPDCIVVINGIRCNVTALKAGDVCDLLGTPVKTINAGRQLGLE